MREGEEILRFHLRLFLLAAKVTNHSVDSTIQKEIGMKRGGTLTKRGLPLENVARFLCPCTPITICSEI